MPNLYDHAIAVLIFVGLPIRALAAMRRLERVPEAELPQARLSIYRGGIAAQLAATLIVTGAWLGVRRPWLPLGLKPVWSGGLIGILFGLAVVTVFVVRQGARGPDPRSVEVVRRRMAKLERLMPHDDRELRWFLLLSLAAGVCEEILFRGWLTWYLQGLGLALIPAAGAAALVFGLGHLYQGPRGALMTAVLGAFLGAVYLLSGSLLAGMLIHTLMDVHAGRTMHATYAQDAAEARA